MKEFHMPTRIFFGEGALERLEQLPQRSALFVADPFVVRSGMLDALSSHLDRAGIRWTVYAEVIPDPPMSAVSRGVEALLAARPELLIAVGGGSALDTAKLIRQVAGEMEGGCRPYFVAVPTTSGTGSEVTSFAVVTDEENQNKLPINSALMLPDEAILEADRLGREYLAAKK